MTDKTREKKMREKIKQLRKQLPEPQKCSFCPEPLFNTLVSADTEPYMIGDKPACRKCYFEKLGNEIEEHPIGHPGRLR